MIRYSEDVKRTCNRESTSRERVGHAGLPFQARYERPARRRAKEKVPAQGGKLEGKVGVVCASFIKGGRPSQ